MLIKSVSVVFHHMGYPRFFKLAWVHFKLLSYVGTLLLTKLNPYDTHKCYKESCLWLGINMKAKVFVDCILNCFTYFVFTYQKFG